MTPLFVDSSSWSLLFRRDGGTRHPTAARLERAIRGGEDIVATGLVLQEVLQGFPRPATVRSIVERFTSVELLVPTRHDHLHAAEIRNRCRRSGVQLGTVDALLAALCIDRGYLMLTADEDFHRAAGHVPLLCWQPAA